MIHFSFHKVLKNDTKNCLCERIQIILLYSAFYHAHVSLKFKMNICYHRQYIQILVPVWCKKVSIRYIKYSSTDHKKKNGKMEKSKFKKIIILS